MYKSCNDYYECNIMCIYILYYTFLYLSRSLFGGRDNAHPREPYNENNNITTYNNHNNNAPGSDLVTREIL